MGGECSLASRILTSKRSLTCVDSKVSLKIAVLCESLPADSTLEWLLASVRSLMNLEPS